MSTFEHHAEEAKLIETEIVRHGIALGVDWDDAVAVHALAREALAYRPGQAGKVSRGEAPDWRAKQELFGLAELMLKVMAESADENIETHGGPVWKAFGRALWQESNQAGDYADTATERNSKSDSVAGKGTEK